MAKTEEEVSGNAARSTITRGQPGDAANVLSTQDSEVYLTILTVAFQDGNKWRFWDGQGKYAAEIKDQRFLDRVDQGERFGKGDILHCQIRRTQWREVSGSLRAEVEVLRVLAHLPRNPDEQTEMFADTSP